MGTPAFSVPSLQAVARVCDVVAVVTQPDRPAGRGQKLSPSAVAAAAQVLGLEVLKVDRVNERGVVDDLRARRADLFAVVAFGGILRPELLAVPRLGSINLHGSLLPEYRGASPVQRALWEGCAGTGVTTLWMDEGVDTGDVIFQRWVAIEPADHAGTLATRLAEVGAPLLAESLVSAAGGQAPRRAQDRAAGSYAPKLAKRDGVIDWAGDAVAVWNRQRAVTPWPGAATSFRGRRLAVVQAWPEHLLPVAESPGTVMRLSARGIEVSCAPGALRLTRVKPEGKAEMEALEWARGARVEPGERLETMKEALA